MSELSATSINALFESVYDRLKKIAKRQLKGSPRNTLNTTALVHELFLRLENDRNIVFEEPAQLFNYAARAMRNLLIDQARSRMRQKAGGDLVRVTLTGELNAESIVRSAEEAVALENALIDLERSDARAARVLELRYFVGLAPEHIAEILNVTRRTVDRDWRFACAYLKSVLS